MVIKVAHGAHVVGKELQREERVVVHGAQVLGEAVAHGVHAGTKRIGDHIHDRPLTAILEGPFVIVDGLARGGIEKSHDQPAAHNSLTEKPHEKQAPVHNLQKNNQNTHVLPSLEIKF